MLGEHRDLPTPITFANNNAAWLYRSSPVAKHSRARIQRKRAENQRQGNISWCFPSPAGKPVLQEECTLLRAPAGLQLLLHGCKTPKPRGFPGVCADTGLAGRLELRSLGPAQPWLVAGSLNSWGVCWNISRDFSVHLNLQAEKTEPLCQMSKTK